MAFIEDTIESKIVYEGPVFNIRKHLVHTVDGGTGYRDILEHSGGSVMIGVKDDGKIILERQYRKTLDREVLELPAGKRDPNEPYEVTAARELREETGYTAGSVKHLLTVNPNCGYSNENLGVYICRDLVAGEKEWDPSEDIDIYEYTADELVNMVLAGEISDAKTVIGILFARAAGEI